MSAHGSAHAALILIGLTIALILAIAWREFGRPRHAATWSIGFGLIGLIGLIAWLDDGATGRSGGVAMLSIAGVASVVNTIGFRQRSGLPPRVGLLLAAAAIHASFVLLLTYADVPPAIRLAPLHLLDTIMFGVAAATLIGRRQGERAAERAAEAVLLALALLSLGLFVAGLAATVRAESSDLVRFESLSILLLPAAIDGIGLFTIFLLAADLADQTRRLAGKDMLTGLLNRRGFEQAARAIIARARKNRTSITLALIDIDRFKSVNDRFGHPAGDLVIQRFGHCLKDHAARRDPVARMGGEEFAILMTDVDATTAMQAIEVLRQCVVELDVGLPLEISASFGVTELRDGDAGLATLLARADRALYRSKAEGRNRATLAD